MGSETSKVAEALVKAQDRIAELEATERELREALKVLASEAYWARTWEDSHFEDTDEPIKVPHHIACNSKDAARTVTDDNPIAADAVREAGK